MFQSKIAFRRPEPFYLAKKKSFADNNIEKMAHKKIFLFTIILSILFAPVFAQKKKSAPAKKAKAPVPAAVNPTTTKSPEAKTAVDKLKKTPPSKQKKEPVIVYNEDFVKGEELFVLNKPEEAIVYLEKALQSDNVDPKVYIYLGVSYYQIEQYDKSLAICVQGLAKEGTDHKILAYNAGNSCYAMGNYMRADASYAIALREDESYSPAVLNRANAQLKLDHLGDARDNYIKYLEMEPETPQRERIEIIIRLLEEEIARRAKEKPELVNAELIDNEKAELPDELERVLGDEIPQEKKSDEKIPSELVHLIAPELPRENVEKKPLELINSEKIAEKKETPVIPELVGPDGEPPYIPPEQLRLAPVVVAADTEQKSGRLSKDAEKLKLDDDMKRFEEEYRREREEARRAEEARLAAEAEESRRKAAEAERIAEEKRRKAAEEEERIAAQKRAIEEERRNLEKAKMDAEIAAQKRALEEQQRKMEESMRAFEAEQKRMAEENRRKMEEEARIAEEKRKIEEERMAFAAEQKRVMEETRKKAEEDARIKAEAEAKAKVEEELRKEAEEKAQKDAEEKARKEAEEKAKIEAEAKAEEEAKKAAEEARKSEIAKWPAPKISLAIDGNKNFTPDGDGRNDLITFKPSVQYLEEPAESWTLEIMDPQGNLFRTIKGTGNPPSSIEWNGTSENGEVVVSRNTYKANLTVVPSKTDRVRTAQMKAVASAEIHTGLLLEVIVPGHEWKIVVQSIAFDPNAAGFNKVTKEQKLSNAQTLDEVADEIRELSKSGAEVNIIIEGYANNISGTEREQQEELLPLSQKRAETIVKELIKRGIDPKLLVPKGVGGANPIADKNDRANWWKNRRVEFRIKQ